MHAKSNLWVIGTCLLLLVSGCSSEPQQAAEEEGSATEPVMAEAACGQCLLGLEGKGCELAVRIDGESYFVDGFKMDDLGDSHAEDGLCNVVRKAQVAGAVENGRFVASSFELLPVEE